MCTGGRKGNVKAMSICLLDCLYRNVRVKVSKSRWRVFE